MESSRHKCAYYLSPTLQHEDTHTRTGRCSLSSRDHNKYTSCAVSYENVIGASVARSDHNLNVTFVLSDAGIGA